MYRSRRIWLGPVLPQHYLPIYSIISDGRIAFRWRSRGFIPTFEQFVQNLNASSLCNCAVLRPSTGEVIGLATALAVDYRNGHCQIGLILAHEFSGSGLGVEATHLFIEYVFSTWPLRAVLLEVPEFNYDGITGLRGSGKGPQPDLVMPQHRRMLGRDWDTIVVSIAREEWDDLDHKRRIVWEGSDSVGRMVAMVPRGKTR